MIHMVMGREQAGQVTCFAGHAAGASELSVCDRGAVSRHARCVSSLQPGLRP